MIFHRSYFCALLISVLLLCPFVKGMSQKLLRDHVIFKSELSLNTLTEKFGLHNKSLTEQRLRCISKSKNLYLLICDKEMTDYALTCWKKDHYIEEAYFDIAAESRQTPNDMLFDEQWAIRFSNIDEVWDITTGGLLTSNENFVIAVLDGGFDISHEDLADAYFTNAAEIPNNNIDDDQNGYVDDYLGINIRSGKDNHVKSDHGTSVSGIISAKSNNNIGIAGINWNNKQLIISNVLNTSDIIAAYDYIKEMKQLYIQTKGAKGANILISTYSGGIPKVFGDSGVLKEWCDFYDDLGEIGILSFGATSNKAFNVDVEGDMPTTCSSPYFVSVASHKRGGEFDEETGFGPLNIDLAAPGRQIITTDLDNKYISFDGTSGATPIVAGTASLLFSIKCQYLDDLIDNSKPESVLLIKNAILDGVTKSSEMQNKYLSEGYLNAKKSLLILSEKCDDILIPSERGALRFTEIIRKDSELEISFISPDEELHQVRWVDPKGSILFYQNIQPQKYGVKKFKVPIPDSYSSPVYLSLTNGRSTVSKAYKFD